MHKRMGRMSSGEQVLTVSKKKQNVDTPPTPGERGIQHNTKNVLGRKGYDPVVHIFGGGENGGWKRVKGRLLHDGEEN